MNNRPTDIGNTVLSSLNLPHISDSAYHGSYSYPKQPSGTRSLVLGAGDGTFYGGGKHRHHFNDREQTKRSYNGYELSMDMDSVWRTQPLFDGRGMRDYPANVAISETPAGHAPYAYDAGRPHLGFPSALLEGAGAALSNRPPSHHSNECSTSSQSLDWWERSCLAESTSQAYSHNQNGEHHGHMAIGSQYTQGLDYTIFAQSTLDSMSGNLQRHQHAEAIDTPDLHSQSYHSSHFRPSALPRLPLVSSPPQAIYHQSYAAPNLAVNSFTTVDPTMKFNQVHYLPSQNRHLQSPLPAVASASGMSELLKKHSATPQSRSLIPGQRVDIDRKMLANSFRRNDDHSRVRRQLLKNIQRQLWFHSNQEEPKMDVHVHRDILKHGLGRVGMSIYTVFLVEDKDSSQWRCLFGSEEMSCEMTEKRFGRVERAIGHVRNHLGHRPFMCDGTCHKVKSTGINCGKRFFAAGSLEDHKRRQRRANSEAKENCTIQGIDDPRPTHQLGAL